MAQPDLLEIVAGDLFPLRLADAPTLEPIGGVVDHTHPRENAVPLKDQAAFGRRSGDRHAIDVDPTLGHRQQAGHQLEQRGLAASGRPDQADEFVRWNDQAHVRYRLDDAATGAAERLPDMLQPYLCHRCCRPSVRGVPDAAIW